MQLSIQELRQLLIEVWNSINNPNIRSYNLLNVENKFYVLDENLINIALVYKVNLEIMLVGSLEKSQREIIKSFIDQLP